LILIGSEPADDIDAIKIARRLWAKYYGTTRNVEHARRDVGIWRGARKCRTETRFIAQRRQAIGDLLKQSSLQGVPRTPMPALPDSQIREATFQMNKTHRRILAALENGTLPYDELTDDLAKELMAAVDKMQGNSDGRYFAEQNHRRAIREKPERPDLSGQGVFIADDVAMSEKGQLRVALRKGGMWPCTDRVRAGVFVMDDVTKPGLCNHICAVLSGALLVSPLYLTSRGEHGPSVHYEAAIRKKKSVWCSPAFIAKHGRIYDIISSRSRMADSAWTWLPNRPAVLAQARRKSSASRLLIFVVPREQRSQDSIQM
jgi:hypothetical protein